jgi:hypothetical protein
MWLWVARRVKEHYGIEADRSTEYLHWVQQLLDEGLVNSDNAGNAYEAIGCVFGMILADHVAGLDWCVYEDGDGRDLCLRYRDTPLKVFPIDMIARRVEEREPIRLRELFNQTRERLLDLSKEAVRTS